jgi:hypothetical protein
MEDAPNKSRTRPKKTTLTVLSGPLLSSRPPLDSDLGDVDSNLGDVDSTREGLELPFESTARERRVAIAAERATYLLICRSERSLNLVLINLKSVIFYPRIRDILVRVRIHESAPLTNKTPTKIRFFSIYFCLLFFEGTFTSLFKEKKSERSHKTVDIKVFITIFDQ